MKLPWIKNTKGEPSASLTLVIVTFVLMMTWLIVSVVPFFNLLGIEVMPFDAAEAMMVLGPMLGLYWGRRNTDAKSPNTQK